MWALLSRRFRRWLLFALGAPLAASALHHLGCAIERRRGSSRWTRGMKSVGTWMGRKGRGPLSKRTVPDADNC